ncbi:MAG TPA: glycosyltransferase [Candidatus Saccharimonadales bacterium]|nr:glycosyltransferase [Candidatus Saccharimonadales bacterium]
MKGSRAELEKLNDALDAARRRIAELEAELQRARLDLAQSTESAAARIALTASRRARRLVPPNSRRQQSLHIAASRTQVLVEHGPAAVVGAIRRDRGLRRAIGVADTVAARRRQYRAWLALHTPSAGELARMRSEAEALVDPVVISVVMPVRDPQHTSLDAAIRSVLTQAYPHLELCIADDASTKPYVRAVLQRAARDARVRVVHRGVQGGIAAASNSAVALATGEFVAFLDHDDVLRPHALFAVAEYLRSRQDADVVYSDEDKLLPDGGVGAPAFKPDFSPDRLLGENYVNHLTAMRRSLITEVGGLREGFDGSQDHDLVLRVTERARHVGHIADVLYAWRMAPGSTAIAADQKPHAQHAGRRAVDDALRRRGVDARVDLGPSPGLYIPRYALTGEPCVDVLVVARTSGPDADECVQSVEQLTTYPNRRVTVVQAGDRVAASINAAAKAATGDHLVLLDASVRVITPEWLQIMLELSQRDEIGAVGTRLRYPDGAVAHEGIVLGRLGVADSVDQVLRVIKEASAVSGACLMTRRAVFEQAGGIDPIYRRALLDVDYCLRVRQLGFRVLCTPLAELTWGDAERGGTEDGSGWDERTFTERWGSSGEIPDPYVNANVLWPNPLSLRLG